MTDLAARGGVALVGGVFMLYLTAAGPLYALPLYLLLTLIVVWEALRLAAREGPSRFFCACLLALCFSALTPWRQQLGAPGLALLVLAALCCFRRRNFAPLLGGAVTLGGGLAVLAFLAAGETDFVLILLLATWACDIGAYLVGMNFGRSLMAPTISPKKTWEGAAGGFMAALVTAGLLGLWLGKPFTGLVLGLTVGIAGQIGDLFESLIKRQVGVKDSGSLLPGHGGFYDRFDAFFFSALVARLIVLFLPA